MQETNAGTAVEMREIDGLLRVGQTIDRELLLCAGSPRCVITLDVIAFSKEKFHLIHVEIEVKDTNDHAPAFPRNETRLEILESAPLYSRFPLDAAVDLDVGDNYIQSYNISASSHFVVEERLGDDGFKYAELVLVRELDREVEDHYTVQVTAADGGTPPRSGSVTVHIQVLDFNDNSPTFEVSSLEVQLYEDAPVGHRVLRVRAFDPDQGANGEVTYALADGPSFDGVPVFHLDPHTGDVTLRAPVDFEKRRSYELTISATDAGSDPSPPSTCTVLVDVVDVNDNAPELSVKPMTSGSDGVAYITEAAAAESFVALVGTVDRDSGANGRVRISLHGHDHFRLQQAYGDAFMIVTTGTLDREKIPEYNLTVVAEDLGSPPFRTSRQYTIRVTDENDNAPLFSRAVYDISVLENNVPGSYVTTLVARDPDAGKNARVSYSLLDSEVPAGGHISTYFSVDPLSGSLYTLRSFDYETLRQVELGVRAEDGGSPPRSGTSVVRIRVVDQNDNAPFFTFPVAPVNGTADVPLPVHAPAGYLALRAEALDRDEGDNGRLVYRIVRGDLALFAVNADTGEVALRRRLPESASVGDALELTIGASDHGRTPRTAAVALRLVVSDGELSEERAVVAAGTQPGGEERPGLDGSLVAIVMLGGGCALLLVAIVIVVVSCKLSPGGERDPRRPKRDGLFDGRPPAPFSFGGPGERGFFRERTASSLDDSGPYEEERSRDSETKMFLPSKHSFQPTAAWQGDKYCLQVSGVGHTDQLSVKDSGKGDSDFNDSDSDISGDVGKKTLSTFHPLHTGSADVAHTQTPACQSDGSSSDRASYT
ncbi:hypothetical protein NHX12_007236, partial [Muraenolepis orangiensis]